MMKGGIDEKIWQRQVTKMGLASSVMDHQQQGGKKGPSSTASFSKEELRDLFRLDKGRECQTHELLGCQCKGRGVPPPPPMDDDSTEGFQNIDDLDNKGDDKPTPTTIIEDDSSNDASAPEFAPLPPKLKPASTVDMAAQEAAIAASRKSKLKEETKMQHLMSYSHIDIGNFEGEDGAKELETLIEDEVLLNVLRDEECSVGCVWGKSTI